jgi:DNA-binding NtrC family response regulator
MTGGSRSPRDLASAAERIVFVIDDDVAVRTTLSSLFRSIGLRVELFGSAHEFAQIKMPDVASCLVLDIRLPGVSGLDFQAELAEVSHPDHLYDGSRRHSDVRQGNESWSHRLPDQAVP